MFRLVFLAFHGERRTPSPDAAHPAAAAQGHHAGAHPEEEEPAAHGHDGHIHDAPPSMAIPLIVLAIGSVVAGYVGVPHALGGSNRIESFLEPSFAVSERARRTQTLGAEAAPAAPEGVRTASLERQEHTSASTEHGSSEELMLMAISSAIAIAGIVIAAYFWLRNRPAADATARRLDGLYNLLFHKYYVDEVYDAAIVQPIKIVSTGGLWRGVDAGLIDGAVNGLGQTIRAGSGVLRRIQTGSVRTYAASLFLGVVLILGWYLFR
jgi:NADH-quinone oxidoreductase subunit L